MLQRFTQLDMHKVKLMYENKHNIRCFTNVHTRDDEFTLKFVIVMFEYIGNESAVVMLSLFVCLLFVC